MRPNVMWLLWRMRNIRKKFFWKHIYDCRVSILNAPVLRLHSARIQPVPLKMKMMMMMMMFKVNQVHRHNSHKIAVDSAVLSSEECSTPTDRGAKGKNESEAPYIIYRPTTLSIFMLDFAEDVTLHVVETNRYHWCMDSFDKGPSSEPDVTVAKYFRFLQWHKCDIAYETNWQITQKNRPVLHSILQQHDVMKQIFTHPSVSGFHRQQEWSWQGGKKLKQTMENLGHITNPKQDFPKFYNPSENLAIDEAVQRKGDFDKIYSQERQPFWHENYKLCNPTGYMKVYMGKDRQGMAQHLAATHAKVTKLIRKQKDVATNCTWKISFPFLNFSMTW